MFESTVINYDNNATHQNRYINPKQLDRMRAY